jgi:hypothetical protein
MSSSLGNEIVAIIRHTSHWLASQMPFFDHGPDSPFKSVGSGEQSLALKLTIGLLRRDGISVNLLLSLRAFIWTPPNSDLASFLLPLAAYPPPALINLANRTKIHRFCEKACAKVYLTIPSLR